MTKAFFQCMKAVEQFVAKKQIINEEMGWIVAGGSKRGWTTWMVGAVTCEKCSKIAGIVPIVPIIPSLQAEVHRQWRAYQGFTFVFKEFLNVHLMTVLDTPRFSEIFSVIDPLTYGD